MNNSLKRTVTILSFAIIAAVSISAQEAAPAAVKVGVMMPKASFSEGVDNAQMAAGLRSLIGDFFKGSSVEVVQIDALLPKAAAAEAKEKECAYLLQVGVTQKKGGGGFGMFKAIAPVLSSVVPMAGMAGVAGSIAGSVASTAISSAASMSGSTKSKDQFTFEYALISTADNTVKSTASTKAKAKSDGEDVLSPMIEKMAEAILAATK